MSEAVDHFVPVPLRFVQELNAGEIDPMAFLIGVLVAHRCYEVRNTAGGLATVRLSTLAELCELSDETVRRKLHELRERGWINFERPKPGPGIGWRIWLIGLERDGEAERVSARSPRNHDRIATETAPPVWQFNATEPVAEEAAIPYDDWDRSSTDSPHDDAAVRQTRRDEKRRELSVRRTTTRL